MKPSVHHERRARRERSAAREQGQARISPVAVGAADRQGRPTNGSATRAYAYGCRPPVDNASVALNQLERAHRYYNVLIEIERERRAKIREAEQAARVGAFDEAKQAALEAAKNEATEAARQRVRDERKQCGVYWGTYLCIEDAVERAGRATRLDQDPRFRPWLGEGLLAVQIQGGMSPEKLCSGTDTRVRLVGEGKRRHLWLRVGSDGRAPVWAAWPIVYHRPLPPGASIKWVRVTARRVASHTKWNVHFILEAEPEVFALLSPTKGTVAIDVGWRKLEDGLRVAAWVDDTGQNGELRLPRRILDRWKKTEELASIRERNFNAALASLIDERRGNGEAWPKWLHDATQHAHAWRSPAKLASLALRWRENRFEEDEALFSAVEQWRKQDKHLYEWEANQRQAVLRERRECYRLFARHLAEYRTVVVEKMDLRAFAVRPGKDEEQVFGARLYRFKAGLSGLVGACRDAVARAGGSLREVDPAGSTQTCSVCGKLEQFDAAREIEHVCSHCAAVWDQDVNAARNLLARAAQLQIVADTRSTLGNGDIEEDFGKAATARNRGRRRR